MNVEALKTNITEIGTKIAKETKVKADALKEKAGEALANAKQKKEANAAASGEDAIVVADGGEPTTPTSSKRSSAGRIQDTIAGVADKIHLPNVRVGEGSIADILLKAKDKVFKGGDAAAADVSETAVVVAGDPADFENMKTEVESLVSDIESTANDKESPKEKVQKKLVVILGKLKAAQDKFVAMVEAKKKEKAEATAAAAAAKSGEEGEAAATAAAAEGAEEGSKTRQSIKNVLLTAEAAARVAFENAERVAREAAKKTGLFDGEKRKSAADTLNDIADANDDETDADAAPSGETPAEPTAEPTTESPAEPPAAAPPTPPAETNESPKTTETDEPEVKI